ncbi:MAG: hypothetical protein JWO94_2055, partial [Verrucomicrobiaceae bacterium]|nr:hypothetical protein [Verrucomicrobiaceae bacterium]
HQALGTGDNHPALYHKQLKMGLFRDSEGSASIRFAAAQPAGYP